MIHFQPSYYTMYIQLYTSFVVIEYMWLSLKECKEMVETCMLWTCDQMKKLR